MAVDRLERVNSLLRRVIGEAMFRVLQGDDVNPGVVTVTAVACAKNLRNATVKVSVFGDAAEQSRVMGHIIRRTHEFERIVNAEVRLKFTPQLRFVIDHSLEKGDHVLSIISEIEKNESGANG
ncbi:MAG: 30S ribosome-binding factor RbfA [Kiritimatiellae bacterium]|jgi:ribosome-binding factor A|nr:30S ribosome-binding factor RbfA [Kiritimatiellia bacterium]MBR6735022.1 30S ribosome-binding factor RbfA [Kiritimatiellia bacterium]